MEYHEIHDPAARVRADFEHREEMRRRDAEKRRVAEEGRAAIAAIEDDRVRELVTMVDRFLSIGVGSDKGYFPTVGGPETVRLRAALAALGVQPDHDRVRVKLYPQEPERLYA